MVKHSFSICASIAILIHFASEASGVDVSVVEGDGQINPGVVTTTHILDATILGSDISEDAITSDHILDNTLTSDDLAEGSVSSSEILDGSITAIDIGAAAITTDSLADNAVTTSKITDDAIVTDKIAEEAVTESRLATNAVSTRAIADNAVSYDKLSEDLQGRWQTMENTLANHTQDIEQLQDGVAMSMALSGMQHPVDSKLGVAVGSGFFAGKTAIGFQASYKADSEKYLFSVGVAATGDEVGGRATVSFSLDDIFR